MSAVGDAVQFNSAQTAVETWESTDTSGNGNDDGGESNGDGAWSDWSKVTTAGPWTIWGRQNSQTGAAEYLAKASQDGETVFLQGDGSVAAEKHVFDSQTALGEALAAWQEKRSSGDTPPVNRTGSPPTSGPGGPGGPGTTGTSGGLVGMAAANPVLTLAVGTAVAYVLYRQYKRDGFPFSEFDSIGGEGTPEVK